MYTANQAANANLLRLVEAYRRYGHFKAELDPLTPSRPDFKVPQLDISNFGFSDADLSKAFTLKGIGTYLLPAPAILSNSIIVSLGQQKDSAKLSEIVEQLQKSYCNKIGVQFAHVEVFLLTPSLLVLSPPNLIYRMTWKGNGCTSILKV